MLRHHYGVAFGTNAGARWRQLFVVALMPWLKKYRNLRNLDRVLEEKEANFLEGSETLGISEKGIQLPVLRKRKGTAPAAAPNNGTNGVRRGGALTASF